MLHDNSCSTRVKLCLCVSPPGEKNHTSTFKKKKGGGVDPQGHFKLIKKHLHAVIFNAKLSRD